MEEEKSSITIITTKGEGRKYHHEIKRHDPEDNLYLAGINIISFFKIKRNIKSYNKFKLKESEKGRTATTTISLETKVK